MASSRYAGVFFDRHLFLTLDSRVAIMLNIQNGHICQKCGYVKEHLNEER